MPAKVLRAHFGESDTYQGKPLFEAIVARCRELQIAGATVFRGLEGFGETGEIHRHHLVTRDQPIVLVVVDSVENIEKLKPVLENMMTTGMIVVSAADVIRVRN